MHSLVRSQARSPAHAALAMVVRMPAMAHVVQLAHNHNAQVVQVAAIAKATTARVTRVTRTAT
jgi:hypothetical protein